MRNQAGSSRFDTVLKMLLIAFISLLAFSSGVYFGREMTENDYQLKALESDLHESNDHATEKSKDYDTDEEDAVASEDVDALSEKFVKAGHEEAEHHGDAPDDSNHESAPAKDAHGKSHGESKSKDHAKETASNAAAHAAEQSSGNEKKATADPHATSKNVAKEVAAHAAAGDDHGHAAPAAAKKVETRNVASANAVKPIVKSHAPHGEDEIDLHAAQAAHGAKTAATKAQHDEHGAKSVAGKHDPKPDLGAVHEAARRVANNEAPAIPSKPEPVSRVPSSLPKSVGTNTEFTVQVASYPSLDEARSHANDLVKKGFPAYPVEANVKGKTWYRVSVGSFKTQGEAGNYRSQLMKQAELNSAIVQKIER